MGNVTRIDERNKPWFLEEAKVTEYSGENKRPGILCAVAGRFQHADVKNGNGRVYPRSLWEKVLANHSFQERLRRRHVVGELDHPESGVSSYSRVSHLVTEVELKENGEVWGKAEVLDTPHGQILNTLLKAGVTVGISSRGDGSLHEKDDGTVVVEDDYMPETWDFVVNPSTPGAYPALSEAQIQNDKRIKGAVEALVKSTEDVKVLFESYRIINELAGLDPQEKTSLIKAIEEKVKNNFTQKEGNEMPNENKNGIAQLPPETAALVMQLSEARVAEAEKAQKEKIDQLHSQVSQLSTRNLEIDKRLRAAEALIDAFSLKTRQLKEQILTTSWRVAEGADEQTRRELAAAKALLEAALKAIEKLKTAGLKAEAAESLVASLLEYTKGDKVRRHIDKLLMGESKAKDLRTLLEGCKSIIEANRKFTSIKKLSESTSQSFVREPLPPKAGTRQVTEGRQQALYPIAGGKAGGDAISKALIGKVGGV